MPPFCNQPRVSFISEMSFVDLLAYVLFQAGCESEAGKAWGCLALGLCIQDGHDTLLVGVNQGTVPTIAFNGELLLLNGESLETLFLRKARGGIEEARDKLRRIEREEGQLAEARRGQLEQYLAAFQELFATFVDVKLARTKPEFQLRIAQGKGDRASDAFFNAGRGAEQEVQARRGEVEAYLKSAEAHLGAMLYFVRYLQAMLRHSERGVAARLRAILKTGKGYQPVPVTPCHAEVDVLHYVLTHDGITGLYIGIDKACCLCCYHCITAFYLSGALDTHEGRTPVMGTHGHVFANWSAPMVPPEWRRQVYSPQWGCATCDDVKLTFAELLAALERLPLTLGAVKNQNPDYWTLIELLLGAPQLPEAPELLSPSPSRQQGLAIRSRWAGLAENVMRGVAEGTVRWPVDVLLEMIRSRGYEEFDNFWAAYDRFRADHPQYTYRLAPVDVIRRLQRMSPTALYILGDDDWDTYEDFRRNHGEYTY